MQNLYVERSRNVGTITTTIALAIFNQDLQALREALAEAWEFYEVKEAETAINRAYTASSGDCRLWFQDAVKAIQSGAEEV